jgi:amino acid permease
MIQRIQTLYLFLAIVALILMFFFPMAVYLSDLEYIKLFVTGAKNMAPNGAIPFGISYALPLIIAVVVIGSLAGVSIALFKNRQKQIQLTNIAVLLNILYILAMLFVYIPLVEKKTGIVPDTKTIGIYLPVISLMFLVLANRAIKRDDKLVRASERLR